MGEVVGQELEGAVHITSLFRNRGMDVGCCVALSPLSGPGQSGSLGGSSHFNECNQDNPLQAWLKAHLLDGSRFCQADTIKHHP